jgi:hypothetical protein
MKIISVRENPEYKDKAVKFFQDSWNEVYPMLYKDSITNCINAENNLPQWYLLEKDKNIIGCAGLVTNDFISRMNLYPWISFKYGVGGLHWHSRYSLSAISC